MKNKNKIYAIALAIVGIISVIPNGDATALVIILLFAIPLFFSKEEF